MAFAEEEMADQGGTDKQKLLVIPYDPKDPRYEPRQVSSEESQNKPSHALLIEMGSGSQSNLPEENASGDWDKPMVLELEELLCSGLRGFFTSAIQKICESGYSINEGKEAIWECSLNRSVKDVELYIEDAITFLEGRKEGHIVKEHDLDHIVKYTMLGMVYSLMECKPSLSTDDAMWALMLCELNISHACALEEVLMNEITAKENSGENSSNSEAVVADPIEPNAQNADDQIMNFEGNDQDDENFLSSLNGSGKTFSRAADQIKNVLDTFTAVELQKAEMNKGYSRKSSRDWKYHQRQSRGENQYISIKPCPPAKNTKNSLDKKPKKPPKSRKVDLRSASSSKSEAVQANAVEHSKDKASKAPAVEIEPPGEVNYYEGIPYDESSKKYCPRDAKEVAIINMVPLLLNRQNEIQNWTNWANEKVMQAADRLRKNRTELQALKKEKEDWEKSMHETKNMEEAANKRLDEMNGALKAASIQVDKNKAFIIKLQEEKVVLKKNKELAAISCAKHITECEAAVQREKEALKKVQMWDEEKRLLQDEFVEQKRKVSGLDKEVARAAPIMYKIQGKIQKEWTEKNDFLQQVAYIRNEKKQLKAQAHVEKQKIRNNAEIQFEKYKEEKKKTEDEISEIQMKAESKKIAELRWGMEQSIGGSCSNNAYNTGRRNVCDDKGLRPDQECVMCLADERSVVFLPCAHQVLCPKCSELHEKKGMKDCPSCRTPIRMRIKAVFYRPRFL